MRPESRTEAPDQAGGQTEFDRREITIPATPEGVRLAIDQILSMIDPVGLVREDLHTMEIALGEVLNNVVEHAYGNSGMGQVDISVEDCDSGLAFTIWDDGAPMPAGRLPLGHAADPNRAAHEQAEGGYGLFLIRQLARKLRYHRVGDRNRLSFRIALGTEDRPG